MKMVGTGGKINGITEIYFSTIIFSDYVLNVLWGQALMAYMWCDQAKWVGTLKYWF